MGKFQASPNFIHRKITGLDVLISVGENIAKFNGYIQLNAAAAFLWDTLQRPNTPEELTQLLAQHFGISRETACVDVAEFLGELAVHNMVKELDDGV